MLPALPLYLALAVLLLVALRRVQVRLRLSRAKHPSLRGHSKMSRRVARRVPFYEFRGEAAFDRDGAPEAIVAQRRAGFERLSRLFRERAPRSLAITEELEPAIADLAFINAYRVPFPFRNLVRENLPLGNVATESSGTRIRDADGNWAHDLSGSYGVNVFGYDFYKQCLAAGFEQAQPLGPVLGPYHPVIADNVERLQRLSGLEALSFHMSGTEAVMQAVRLARYHTGRSHLVRFCGSYHGWWDGVQPGVGSQRSVDDVYTLKEMDADTLKVLRTRKDIACVLVSPLQALHPNGGAPGDATLMAGDRACQYDRTAYTEWLHQVRAICTERGIPLIFDEIFSGFRLARGGAQEYFGVRADLVTYGKTLGGGLPVGVLCGSAALMKRYRDDRPTDICFARGTFNSHPYVMTAMNAFLRRLEQPGIDATYRDLEATWNRRAADLNRDLAERELPLRIENMVSVWSVLYTRPGRYHWMFQYYLRAEGLQLGWTGTGRLIWSHDFPEADFEEVRSRFVAAAEAMRGDGWWSTPEGLTNKAIKRQVLREMISTGLGRRMAGAPRIDTRS